MAFPWLKRVRVTNGLQAISQLAWPYIPRWKPHQVMAIDPPRQMPCFQSPKKTSLSLSLGGLKGPMMHGRSWRDVRRALILESLGGPVFAAVHQRWVFQSAGHLFRNYITATNFDDAVNNVMEAFYPTAHHGPGLKQMFEGFRSAWLRPTWPGERHFLNELAAEDSAGGLGWHVSARPSVRTWVYWVLGRFARSLKRARFMNQQAMDCAWSTKTEWRCSCLQTYEKVPEFPVTCRCIPSGWFQIFFIFTNTWEWFPFWLILFKGIETTN